MAVLKMAQGNPLKGISVSATKFQGVTTLNQLESFGLSRPSSLEHAKARDMKRDHKLATAVSIREEIQRRFDKPRVNRARCFARYIESVDLDGKPGGTPAITLWVEHAMDSDQCGELLIPYGANIVVIDGETQTEARFMLRDDDDFACTDSGDVPVAVTVYHDVSEEFARQILHDHNSYGVRVSEKQLAAQNSEGPLTKAAIEIFAAADIPLEKVNRYGNVPRRKEILAQNEVMYSVIGYVLKESALEKDGGTYLSTMNNATMSEPINGDTVADLSRLVRIAANSLDARKAALPVWQVAGVLTARGHKSSEMNWTAGQAAYRSERQIKPRLRAIAASL